MPARTPKPVPVVVTTICSLCDLPWEDHGEDPTTSDCIRLLKAKVVAQSQTPFIIYKDRWPVQWPNTYYSNTPQWTYTMQSDSAVAQIDAFGRTLGSANATNVIEFSTPRDDDDGDPQSVRC